MSTFNEESKSISNKSVISKMREFNCKIIIVTNHKCQQAVHLYRKFGFQEIPVDKKKFPFERASLAFELYLS